MARVAVPTAGATLHFTEHRAAHAARVAAPAALETWARNSRDLSRPLVWFHAPSVGEGLQARAVIRELRPLLPEAQFIYTHYSASAAAFAATVGADWHGYQGYDRRSDVDPMLAAASPDLVVLAKLDLWPEFAVRTCEHGARLAMIAATVSPASQRLRWPSLPLTRAGYAALDAAAAVDQRSADLLAQLGTDPARITVTGDPRIDSVLDAADGNGVGDIALPLATDHTLVAGSTWPADEDVLLPAFVEVRREHPDAQLLLVPHDPTPARVEALLARARQLALTPVATLSALDAGAAPAVIVVDKVGLLARLYRVGAFAYVGGGFGRRGIHSVFEPAAWSRSVIIGPRDRDSPDAHLLADAGALVRLPAHHSAHALASVWRQRLDDAATTRSLGVTARRALEQRRGGARTTAQILVGLVSAG